MSLDVVLVGAGLMGRWHAHAIAASGARLVAVVDPDGAGSLGVPTETLKAALSRTPSVVHVCSPPGSHGSVVECALAAGAHVVVEKPVSPDLSKTRSLLDLAVQSGLSLTPVLQFSFQPWWSKRSDLGSIISMEHAISSAGGEGRPTAERDELAWGIAWHGLSLAHRLGADIGQWSVSHPGPGELRALATGSTSVSLSVSLAGRPPRNEFTLVGARGTLRADLSHGFATVDTSGSGRADKALRPFRQATGELAGAAANLGRRAIAREPAFPGLQALVAAAHAHARGEAPPPLMPDHVLAVAEAAEQLRRRP